MYAVVEVKSHAPWNATKSRAPSRSNKLATGGGGANF